MLRVWKRATEILIVADGGGSNSDRGRLWKRELQGLANETGLTVRVSHLPLGTIRMDGTLAQYQQGLAPMISFTAVCNATGVPAMSVPLAWTDDGLPIGLHFVGRFGAEETLFSLAAQLESAAPWRDRRPSGGNAA